MGKIDFNEIFDMQGALSLKWEQYPDGVIPMWIADTDFPAPPEVVVALHKRAGTPNFGYANSKDMVFEKAVCRWEKERFGWSIAPETVLHTYSVLGACVNAILVFTQPGDSIAILTPIYTPFYRFIPELGRRIAASPLRLIGDDWHIDWLDFEACLADSKTSMFILCSPHNPVGKCFTKQELQAIACLCEKYNVFVFSDEVHADIVYPGSTHIPFSGISEWARDNSMVCTGPGKTFNLSGMRAAAAIVQDFGRRESFNQMLCTMKTGCQNVFGLAAAICAYTSCGYYVEELIGYLDGNLKYVFEFLPQIGKIKLHTVQATYLLWLDCRDLRLSQEELMRFFLEEARVAVNDGQSFGEEGIGFVRMNIGCARVRLQEAMKRIQRAYMRRKFSGVC